MTMMINQQFDLNSIFLQLPKMKSSQKLLFYKKTLLKFMNSWL